MDVFVAAVLSFPTVVFTVLLGVVTLYWLLVVLGALDLDVLGGKAEGAAKGVAEGAFEGAAKGVAEGAFEGAAKGVAEGAFEGAAKGVAEGAAHAALGGAAKGVAEGAAKGVAEGAADAGGEGLASVLSALHLRQAPVTVVLSLLVLFGWLFTLTGSVYAAPSIAVAAGGLLASLIVLLLAAVLAVAATSISVRPLERFFVTHAAPRHAALAGKVAVVTTGRVDGTFGQASLEDGGAGLLLQVRCDRDNGLGRGSKVLLVSWEESRQAFVAEPYEDIVTPSGGDGGEDQMKESGRTGA